MSSGQNRAGAVRFSYTADGLDPKKLVVVRMGGQEAISKPYHFSVLLLSPVPDLEKEQLLHKKCTLTVSGSDTSSFHGVLTHFKWVRTIDRYSLYEAEFGPRLHLLRQTRASRVFLFKNIREFAEEVLQASGVLTAKEYDFRLAKDYPQREYVCQYNESDFDFLNRWFEHYGIFYFFEQTDSGEVMVISDNPMGHAPVEGAGPFQFVQSSGLETLDKQTVVDHFSAKTSLLPQSVRVRDYNYRTPGLLVQGTAVADAQGIGESYYYGENPKTPSEAEILATIRAEGLACRKSVYNGRCYTPLVRSGFLMTLQDHNLGSLNRDYLVIEAQHRGSQESYLQSGLTVVFQEKEKFEGYTNTFKAIPASTPFRPELRTPRPVASSSQSAFIDSPGGSMEAHLDDQGRYKVRLPFDLSGQQDGKASTWLRMAQPYVGKDFGMHFPLLKGTEVLLGFVHGDPDRPVITGAAPNPDYPSQVNDASETKCRITSAAQNTIYMENQENKQYIVMRSPTEQSWIRLGAPNDPPSANWGTDSNTGAGSIGVNFCTGKGLVWKAGAFNSITLGESGSFMLLSEVLNIGGNSKTVLLLKAALNFGWVLSCRIGWGFTYERNKVKAFGDKKELSATERRLCGTLNTAAGHRNRITDITNQLKGVNNDIVNLKNELVRKKAELHGELGALQNRVSTLEMTKKRAEGDVTLLSEGIRTLQGSISRMDGMKSELVERGKELSAVKSNLDGEVSRLLAEKRTLAAAKTNSAGVNATV